MAAPFLIHPFFLNYVLPLILVFTLIFAILEKSKILGDDKRQINAIIGLVVGLILIAFPYANRIIVLLMPFLAVVSVILLVLMLLVGFVSGEKEGDVLRDKWLKIFLGVVIVVALVTFLLIVLGVWDIVYDFLFNSERGRTVWVNVLIIAVIVGAIIAVLTGGDNKS